MDVLRTEIDGVALYKVLVTSDPSTDTVGRFNEEYSRRFVAFEQRFGSHEARDARSYDDDIVYILHYGRIIPWSVLIRSGSSGIVEIHLVAIVGLFLQSIFGLRCVWW